MSEPSLLYTPGMWVEHTSIYEENAPVTSIEYDNNYDMLWMAHANGRIASYTFRNDAIDKETFQPSVMLRYSSFPSSKEMISQILPNHNALIAVSNSAINLYSHGGARLGSLNISNCPAADGSLEQNYEFTCADIVRDPAMHRCSSSGYIASSVIAGTNDRCVYLFDVTQSMEKPLMMYNVTQPSIKVASNGHLMVVAGQDGSLRFLDGKFRSTRVSKALEAHSGTIRDMAMQDDGFTLLTCGNVKRAINPYDPKSPFHYAADVQIKLFDLRMQRLLNALPVTVPLSSGRGVGHVRFISPIDCQFDVDASTGEYCSSVMYCTDDGVIQISRLSDMMSEPNAEEINQQQLYAPITNANETITAAAVANGGQFLAVGTSAGVLGQYVRNSNAILDTDGILSTTPGFKCLDLYKVNEVSPNPKLGPSRRGTDLPVPVNMPPPSPPPAPMRAVSVDHPSLGTTYVLNTPPTPSHNPEVHPAFMLSSAFDMTPTLLNKKMRVSSKHRISNDLLALASRHDFIRFIPNPGYAPNSMRQHHHSKYNSNTNTNTNFNYNIGDGCGGGGGGGGAAKLESAYALCDPRRIQLLQQEAADAFFARALLDDESAARAGSPGTNGSSGGIGGKHHSRDQLTSSAAGSAGIDSVAASTAILDQNLPPRAYLKRSSNTTSSKQRFKKFDYDSCNRTSMIGLENNLPNSTVNPILQYFYSLPALRGTALLAQLSSFHHKQQQHQRATADASKQQTQPTLLCELGFLYHMIGLLEYYYGADTDTTSSRSSNNTSSTSNDKDLEKVAVVRSSAVSATGADVSSSLPRASTVTPQRHGNFIERVARAANFQRVYQTFQLVPEAVALSLFDGSLQRDLQQYIQIFTPFLLHQLSREVDQEHDAGTSTKDANKNAIDDLFGFSVRSSTTFLHSGTHKVDSAPIRAHTMELVYLPSSSSSASTGTASVSSGARAAGATRSERESNSPITNALSATGNSKSPPAPSQQVGLAVAASDTSITAKYYGYTVSGAKSRRHMSFASVLMNSFRKEQFMKGWCKESEAYEPFKKMQNVASLPRVLSLLCGNTQEDMKDATTLAGALGETQGQGSPHDNFWSAPLCVHPPPTADTGDGDRGGSGSGGVGKSAGEGEAKNEEDGDVLRFAWLPVQIEVAFRNDGGDRGAEEGQAQLSVDTNTAATGRIFNSHSMVISCKCAPFTGGNPSLGASGDPVWIIYDGQDEIVSDTPASEMPAFEFSDPSLRCSGNAGGGWSLHSFRLAAAVVQVTAYDRKNLVLHLNKQEKRLVDKSESFAWYLLNDFLVEAVEESDVLHFPAWKQPCIVFYERSMPASITTSLSSSTSSLIASADVLVPSEPRVTDLRVPASVLAIESLSHIPSIRLLPLHTQSYASTGVSMLPAAGDLIAFDGEFVSVSQEKSMINSAGDRVVSEGVRQVLARISLLDMGHGPKSPASINGASVTTTTTTTATTSTTIASAIPSSSSGAIERNHDAATDGASSFNKNMMRVLADDYILPLEPVVDYVTRFSGITEDDLNPMTSKHSVLTQRAAYLKLRYFIDAKCIFVGHGLEKDFETANIFVPPEQVRDTVDLWRLPNQRKISLRFLASYVLKEDIQDEIHDSIEDAKTALLLYRSYLALAAKGPDAVNAALHELYQYGNRNNWTIGLEKLSKAEN